MKGFWENCINDVFEFMQNLIDRYDRNVHIFGDNSKIMGN